MKPKILFVEDELDLGKVVKQYLEISDFEVDWLLDGKAAFEQLKTLHSKYQIALIDVSMPEMDGLEATALLRSKPENGHHLPIIAMTAHALIGDREISGALVGEGCIAVTGGTQLCAFGFGRFEILFEGAFRNLEGALTG